MLAEHLLKQQMSGHLAARKAAEEARDRAAKKFNLDPKELPFFRTLHSFSLAMSDIRAEQVMQKEHYRELSEIMGFRSTPAAGRSFGLIIEILVRPVISSVC